MSVIIAEVGSDGEVNYAKQHHNAHAISCDLLLAALFRHHPDHALVALKGITPARVIDLEPPERPPETVYIQPKVIAFPTITDSLSPPLRPSLKTIFERVIWFYRVSPEDFFSMRRDQSYVRARHMACYLGCVLTTRSLSDIGRQLGRDHSTVLHARHRMESKIKFDHRLQDEIEILKLHIREAMLNAATPVAVPAISQPTVDANTQGNAAH